MTIKDVNLKEITSQLNEYVFTDDVTVTWVLRAHLAIESSIDKILNAFIPRANKITSGSKFSFSHKLELCHAMELINDRMYAILKALNQLRNNCAHQLLSSIKFSDLNKLNSALGKETVESGLQSASVISSNMIDSIQLQKYLIYVLSSCVAQMSAWLALSLSHDEKI
ncbi:hypothetical protein [Enterovibrio norvegicus]|uniref:hypothetical protein n=1 Tax=Enterovibrio norvegicus TaxID=188144 RepID=UPI000C83007D|nr:hypothetical protein [Enterovibrio norvegicus]PMH59628.1 hypothetical protein BCU62_22285 [Enterovibrio norvegicus]